MAWTPTCPKAKKGGVDEFISFTVNETKDPDRILSQIRMGLQVAMALFKLETPVAEEVIQVVLRSRAYNNNKQQKKIQYYGHSRAPIL